MCKALTLTAHGEPVRISICHCLDCKVRSGSAFSFQARWKNEAIQIKGEYRTYVRIHDDGDEARFHFCPHCSSQIFYQTQSMPDLTAIAVGAFADPQFPEPHYSVYEERKHSWIQLVSETMEHYE